MRTVYGLTIVLLTLAPVAAQTSDPYASLRQMVGRYQRVQGVQIIEHFQNGQVATVNYLPPNTYNVANPGGMDRELVLKIATQPAGDVLSARDGNYIVTPLGTKNLEGVKVTGYRIAERTGSYVETLWVNSKNLPVSARVHVNGQRVDVLFGNYNTSPLMATNSH